VRVFQGVASHLPVRRGAPRAETSRVQTVGAFALCRRDPRRRNELRLPLQLREPREFQRHIVIVVEIVEPDDSRPPGEKTTRGERTNKAAAP